MSNVDWYKIKFLESGGNLKPLIKSRVGRSPSTTVAGEIAVCIQQGRLFYEAAKTAPLEIRPLQLFYGMIGFAKALVLAQNLRSLCSLAHSHGITDISADKSLICDLRIKIGNTGTFQEFNDTMSKLNRVCYFGKSNSPTSVYLPTAKSSQMVGLEISLKQLLSMIPGLEELYKNTFQEYANTEIIGLNYWEENGGRSEIRIDDPQIFKNREDLVEIVNRWRERFPFLRQWRVYSASHCWGNSIIELDNVKPSENEFSDDFLVEGDGTFSCKGSEAIRVDFKTILDPLAGGYSHPIRAISPIKELFVSEFSLHYLALYLLSSLVRYRPQSWGYALSRSSTAELPADDRVLALLEQFMALNEIAIPQLVSTALNPYEDKHA